VIVSFTSKPGRSEKAGEKRIHEMRWYLVAHKKNFPDALTKNLNKGAMAKWSPVHQAMLLLEAMGFRIGYAAYPGLETLVLDEAS
jgi:hypothetical protein